MASSTEQSLYHRLGGFDAIAGAMDELIQRITSDPEIGFFWKGHSASTMRKERQLAVEFLSEAFGGPINYIGRDMKTTHTGLGITERHWEIFTGHLVATLDKFGVQGIEREEFLAAASSLKGDIVESQ